MSKLIKIIFYSGMIFLFPSQVCFPQNKILDEIAKINYQNNSLQWQKRNRHLIPSLSEAEAILKLNQDRDFDSQDIDKDGVVNHLDPSPFDWREIGYQPFGVLEFLSWRHPWNEYKYREEQLERVLKLIKESGAAFIRVDFIWEDIEPQKGKYIFDKYDKIVSLCAKENLRLLAILDYSASWAAARWNSPPNNLQDYAEFCKVVVNRYKDKIKYWEIWNEPDSQIYWIPQDDMATYTKLLEISYKAIKQVDPSSKVVLGGVTEAGYYAIKRIYENGGKNYFDIINIHPFVDPLSEQGFQRIFIIYDKLERLMVQFKDSNKKIWFTEIGCPGVGKNIKSKGWWKGKSPDEKKQAEFLFKIYTQLIKLPNLEKIFWAFFRDNKDHFKNDIDYFGLIRWDFSKKKSFYAYKKSFIKWLNSQENYRNKKRKED